MLTALQPTKGIRVLAPVSNKNTAKIATEINVPAQIDFKDLYIRHFPAVKNFVLANSGNEEDARDIYQDAFVAFWRNVQLGKFESKTQAGTSAYILQVAKHKWIDELRKRKGNALIIERDWEENMAAPPDGLSQSDENYVDTVVAHFQKMKKPCRELLYRFYYLKEKFSEIAERYGWTEASAKNNKYRCLQKLRNSISQPDIKK